MFANFHYEYAFENNVTLDLNDFTNKASEDNFNNDIFNRILEVLNIKENNQNLGCLKNYHKIIHWYNTQKEILKTLKVFLDF